MAKLKKRERQICRSPSFARGRKVLSALKNRWWTRLSVFPALFRLLNAGGLINSVLMTHPPKFCRRRIPFYGHENEMITKTRLGLIVSKKTALNVRWQNSNQRWYVIHFAIIKTLLEGSRHCFLARQGIKELETTLSAQRWKKAWINWRKKPLKTHSKIKKTRSL